MGGNQINIRTQKFSKKEIQVIQETLKQWNYEDLVEIIYIAQGSIEEVDATFILNNEDLGEFLWVLFGCGYEFAYTG